MFLLDLSFFSECTRNAILFLALDLTQVTLGLLTAHALLFSVTNDVQLLYPVYAH